MSNGRWALLVGVAVAALGFLAFRPMDCIGVPDDQGMDPSGFHKVCSTPMGVELNLPYNRDADRDGATTMHAGQTGPNNTPVAMAAVLAGAVGALVTFLVLSIRRRGVDELLASGP
ncbi:MAG: hypothetical protein GEU71_07435 [Actinobacteria bacterium]|nr:hypothetical protein [Actinomycetota bacterium]